MAAQDLNSPTEGACDGEIAGERPIVLLTSGGTLSNIVINGLVKRLGPIVVIREPQEPKLDVLRRRARLLGWTSAVGQLAFGIVQRLFVISEVRIREIWSSHLLDPNPNDTVRVYDVPSVNSEEAHVLLRRLNPHVVAVYGTRILTSATLATVAAPFINYHAGINPKYRGQHPGYWALACGDSENAGVTIHLVDRGVDTGSVLYQARVQFTSADTIASYQHLQAAIALPLFARAIEDALEDQLTTQSVDLPSKQWFPPTIWQYVHNGVARGVW